MDQVCVAWIKLLICSLFIYYVNLHLRTECTVSIVLTSMTLILSKFMVSSIEQLEDIKVVEL